MVDMLAVHEHARSSTSPLYHEFLGRYCAHARRVYAFVEGKDDYCYYTQAIEAALPGDWSVDLWHAGNKEGVLRLLSEFDWSRFPQNMVLFFVDKDLAEFLGESHPNTPNLFVTTGYSIESELVGRSCCRSLLIEVCSLHDLTKEELDAVLDLFEEQLKQFYDFMLVVMAWVLAWRRRGMRPCLNDLKLSHAFEIRKGRVTKISKPGGCRGLSAFVCKQLSMPIRNYAKARDEAVAELKRAEPKAYVRGKYVLWFLWQFVSSIHEDCGDFCARLNGKNKPKMRVGVGLGNLLVVVGPRARAPEALRSFLDRNLSGLSGLSN